MIDNETRDRISWWAIKAKNNPDFYIRFILYWFCFNAWITRLSGKDRDYDAIKWFLENDSSLKSTSSNFWQSSRTQSLLSELKNLSPITDNRPGHTSNETRLNDINNLNEVVWYIYQIRCNLFHGSKNPNGKRDSQLVENSSEIMHKWIENALL